MAAKTSTTLSPSHKAVTKPHQVTPFTPKSLGQIQSTDLSSTLQRAVTDPYVAGPSDILALQRKYGNRAVQRLLSQPTLQTKLTVGAAGDLYEQEADRMAEQVMTLPTAELARNQQSPVQRIAEDEEIQTKPDPGVPPKLAADQRQKLEEATRHRIDKAYTAFVSACKDVKTAVASAVRAQAEMVGVLAEVAMGFMAPALARGIATLVNTIPPNASNATYLAVLALQNQDQVKAAFVGATKVGSLALKSNATWLFGESETDAFITQLDTQSQMAFQKISENLSNVNDIELGITCAMYDASVANVETYRTEVMRQVNYFKVVIEPIKEGAGSMIEPHTRAYWVKRSSGTSLAILQLAYEPMGFGFTVSKDKYEFIRWVHPAFQEMAIKRTMAAAGEIKTVEESKVIGIQEGFH